MRGGIVIGTDPSQNKYWTVDDDTHVLLIGTTRSGKSRRVIMPTIWHLARCGESMVICDLKKELQPIAKEYLKRKGYNIITLDLIPKSLNLLNTSIPFIFGILISNNTTSGVYSKACSTASSPSPAWATTSISVSSSSN